MPRFFLTICGTWLLAGLLAAAQQNPVQPQIRTGANSGPRQPATQPTLGLPSAGGVRVPVAPGPNHPATSAQAPGPSSQTVNPARPTNSAPKKDPRIAGGAAAAPAPATEAMGPPAPPNVIPQPARPADMPPVPPQVTYRNGLLTVNAVNSTMSSLLAAIRSRTGIEFDGAENSPERVAVSLGPAPEGEVLGAIFSGSSFDYVILGRADSPDTVQRVVLTPKRGGPVVAGSPGLPQPQPQAQAQSEGEEEVPSEGAVQEEEPQDTAAQPPQVNPPPSVENQQQSPNGAKTPEQLLQELKQMQQRQQEQQGEKPPTGGPPPNSNQVPRKLPN